MNILKQFDRFVLENNLINQGDKVLLAVSGGRDSMLMLWLFIQSGVSIEIAHCNFNLRSTESDGDEDLIRRFAMEHHIVCHIQSFDTMEYVQQHKISIQMAARDLRYAWFEQLRVQRGLDLIAIAQHKNDHVETVLLNLTRGTGLKGLAGIQQRRERIIRPLLFLESKAIIQMVRHYNIPFRDDSSNFSNKYARNKIRLDIIPELEKLNADFISVMDANISRFQETISVLDDYIKTIRDQIFIENGKEAWIILKSDIYGKKIGLLYLLFEPFDFNKSVLEDLVSALAGESGRIFESDNYIILCDRESLVLRKKSDGKEEVKLFDFEEPIQLWRSAVFEISITDDCSILKDSAVAKIDFDKLCLPITIRSWNEGDVFQPLGMVGKKKLSDLFIQRKINLFDKQEVPILTNGNGEIMWVCGFQLDDRYKITQKTKKVLKLVIHK